jgi:hypothetical protein
MANVGEHPQESVDVDIALKGHVELWSLLTL